MKNLATSKKAGISLVALVVTIIVLIILTGAVVVTFMEGGIVTRANESTFKSDMRSYQEQLLVIKSEDKIKHALGEGELKVLSANGQSKTLNLVETKEILPEFKDKYAAYVKVVDGELVLVEGVDPESDEGKWLAALGIGEASAGNGGNGETSNATEISIEDNYRFLSAGGDYATMQLVATTTPANEPVTWSSDDTAVATVDNNGNVTGVTAGTATITAKSGSQTATYEVTVGEKISFTVFCLYCDDGGVSREFSAIDGMKWGEFLADNRFNIDNIFVPYKYDASRISDACQGDYLWTIGEDGQLIPTVDSAIISANYNMT